VRTAIWQSVLHDGCQGCLYPTLSLSRLCFNIVVRAVVGADSVRPKDRSQALHTLNTYMSAVKLNNSTHRRAINQSQEILSGYVVSACCRDTPSAVVSFQRDSSPLTMIQSLKKWLTWPIFSKNCLHTRLHTRAKPGQITQCNDWTFLFSSQLSFDSTTIFVHMVTENLMFVVLRLNRGGVSSSKLVL